MNPPVNEVKDVSGNTYYSPVDESVICDDGVVVMFAPIEMDYQQSIYAKDNLPFLKAFEGWRVISSQWNIYTYQANYSDYLAPFDTFNQMEDFYVYAAASNTYWIYDLGHVYSEGGATGWHMLKGYLAYKLAWNVNSGFNNLVDKYFEYNYGAAKDIMLQWFEEYRIHSGWMIDNYVAGRSSVYSSLLKKEYWSRNLLLKWRGYSETALELIEQEKNKEENLYRIYSLNIRMERVTLYYMLVKLYENDLDASFVNEIKAQCKADCIEAGITARSEGLNKEIENLWSEWGI